MTIWIQSDSRGRPILIGYHDAIISDRPSTGSANPAAPYLHGLGSICARRYLSNRCNWMQWFNGTPQSTIFVIRTSRNVETLAGDRCSVTFDTLQPGQKQGQHQINKMSHFSRCYSSWCHQRLRTDMSPDWNVVNNYKPCASLRARPKRQTHLAPASGFWQQCGRATTDLSHRQRYCSSSTARLAPFRLTGFEKRRYVCRVLRSLI